MGEGGRVLFVEAFSSSGRGHIGPAPFFSLSACLTGADKPHAGGSEFSKLPSVRGLNGQCIAGKFIKIQTLCKLYPTSKNNYSDNLFTLISNDNSYS
jgi:hypothetical protein